MNSDIKIDLDTVVSQNKSLETADMDGEIVMISIDKGKYYGLNNVGSRIWELIAEPKPVKTLVSLLCEEYNINTEMCSSEVFTYLTRLYNEELVFII